MPPRLYRLKNAHLAADRQAQLTKIFTIDRLMSRAMFTPPPLSFHLVKYHDHHLQEAITAERKMRSPALDANMPH